MPLADDLKKLLHPATTDNEIITICNRHNLIVKEEQLQDTTKLKLLFGITLPHTDAYPVLLVLAYRVTGESKYADLVDETIFNISDIEKKLQLIFQFMDPKIEFLEHRENALGFTYRTVIDILTADVPDPLQKGKITSLPMWLRIMIFKAFNLPPGILYDEYFNHKEAAARNFNPDNLLRLAKTLYEGLAEKETNEKLALTAWKQVDVKKPTYFFQEKTAKQTIKDYAQQQGKPTTQCVSIAMGFLSNAAFAPYKDLPEELLFRIGHAYKAPQPGIPANKYAAALCYALVLRVTHEQPRAGAAAAENPRATAAEKLQQLFNEGCDDLPANITAVNRLQLFLNPPVPTQSTALSTTADDEDDELKKWLVITFPKSTENKTAIKAEEKRLAPYQQLAVANSVVTAVAALGLKPEILAPKYFTPKFFAAGGSYNISPSRLASLVPTVKTKWEQTFPTLADSQHSSSVIKIAVETIKTFNQLSQRLATEEFYSDNPEADKYRSSIYTKMKDYLATVEATDKERKNLADPASIKKISELLITGIKLIEEVQALLMCISEVQAMLSDPLNPFITSIRWFPEKIRELNNLLQPASSLITAMKALYQQFIARLQMRELIKANNTLSRILSNILFNQYSKDDEALLALWEEDKNAGLLSSTEQKNLAKTKPLFTATTTALELFIPATKSKVTSNLDTLNKYFSEPGQENQVDQEIHHHNNIAENFRKSMRFIEDERAAKERCQKLGVTKREDNFSWQKTELRTLVNRKVSELRGLVKEKNIIWNHLISGLNVGGNFDAELKTSRRVIFLYLKLSAPDTPNEQPGFLEEPDILKALRELEDEFKAFQEIETLANNSGLFYPASAANDYTRAKNKALRFDFKEPNHFKIQLESLKTIHRQELAASTKTDELIAAENTTLPYTNNYLRTFVNAALQRGETYHAIVPVLENLIVEEKRDLAFLETAKGLLGIQHIATIAGDSYEVKRQQFERAYPAKVAFDTWRTLEPTGLAQAIEQELADKAIVTGLQARLSRWLTSHARTNETMSSLARKELSYRETLTKLNEDVRQEYQQILRQYDDPQTGLETTYRNCYKVTSPSSDRLQKIADLVAYKNQINGNADLQLVEKYILLLGALKKAHDDIQEQHIKGTRNDNGAVTQFFKRHVTHSELATILEQDLTTLVPATIHRGFFGGKTIHLDEPVLTQAQQIYTQPIA